jgi:hypothetical protein
MSPVVLQVVRPYATEEEFLEAEAWTIEGRAMLLLEQDPLDLDTPVVFDVYLESGVRLIRAEARVGGHMPGTSEHAPALRVRFRRYGSQTKAFIERAVRVREEQLARVALEPSSLPPRPRSNHPKPPSRPPEHLDASVPNIPASPAPADLVPPREMAEPSGVYRRAMAPVPPPPNREELLQRLRERARSLNPAEASSPTRRPAGERAV